MIKKIKNIKNFIVDMDKTVLVITIALFVMGLLWISSASSREAVDNMDKTVYYYTIRQIIILGVSGAATLFILSIPMKYERFFQKIWFLLWLAMVGCCIYLIINGRVNRGASNWIPIPIVNFNLQPGEFLKIFSITTLAFMFEKYAKVLRNKKDSNKIERYKTIGKILAIGFIPLPLLIRDFGTLMIYFSIFFIFLISSPILKIEKRKIVSVILICGVSLLILAFKTNLPILSTEQKSRLTNFADPCNESKRNDEGYQICNAYIAMNLGGFNGVGSGKSTQKYSYIPEPHTDMIFSIITEENGFIFGAIVIVLYMILITKIMLLASRATMISGKYICLGLATMIFAHILINLGGLLGILPLTGVPLPFLSYGGSFTIVLCIGLALYQRIHVETKRFKIKF